LFPGPRASDLDPVACNPRNIFFSNFRQFRQFSVERKAGLQRARGTRKRVADFVPERHSGFRIPDSDSGKKSRLKVREKA
jgi:hypothetical protein